MFWNNVRTIINGLEKSYIKEYAKFDEYKDVKGLSEYKDLVVSLRDSDILIEFNKISQYVTDDSNYKTDSPNPFEFSNEFSEMAEKKLNKLSFPFYFEALQGFITFSHVVAILMLINFNYFYYTGMRCSRVRSIEKVFGGNIIQYLSFFTDEFKSMPNLPDFDETFFDNLKNASYEDDRARILEDFLRCGYLSLIFVELNISWDFFNNIKFSAWYLMACNALKRDSLKINCEDVVVGYTMALKLITEDMSQYVRTAFYESSLK